MSFDQTAALAGILVFFLVILLPDYPGPARAMRRLPVLARAQRARLTARFGFLHR